MWWVRFLSASIAALAAISLAIVLWPTTPAVATPPTQDGAAQQLADKYAPIVFLPAHDRDCDTGAVFQPAPVDVYFGEEEIVLMQRASPSDVQVAASIDAADLYNRGDDFYINLPGNPQQPDCTYERDYQRFRDDDTPVAYVHIARQPGHDGIALQYWFFYYFNDWNNKHEGDWEMVQLLFDAETPEEALQSAPYATGYSQHSSGESADWDSDKVRKDGDHPHVYSATGAHSNFYRDRTYLGRAEQGAGFGCDVASSPVVSLPVEARLVPAEISGPDDPYAWATFEGRWGERQSGQFNGPTGPNTKRAWTQPFDWQDELRETSVEVPISRDLEVGVNAASLFCDIVTFASNNLLVAFMSSPWVFLGAAALMLGVAGVTFSRTTYSPALPEPLRRTRHFGQIMSSAARIYARHPITFLVIGLIFVPAGVIASILQIAIASIPFTGPVYDILMRSTLSQLAVVLGIGSFFVIIAFSIVVACVARVLGDLDDGVRPGAVRAYRAVWDRLPALFLGRLRADVITTLFGVTIIGLPWAINRLVRWSFVEWAIMLEGHSASTALDASSRVVDGHWWRTLGVAFIVVAVGLGTGPVLGLVMLFITDWPLATVNAVSTALFLALVPWTGIALTLLYYDLKARGEADAIRA